LSVVPIRIGDSNDAYCPAAASAHAAEAVRRVERGELTADEEERVGTTLMLLDERMAHLLERFDLTPDELNIDLGPLGAPVVRSARRYPARWRCAWSS
jgi:hypothetical protein